MWRSYAVKAEELLRKGGGITPLMWRSYAVKAEELLRKGGGDKSYSFQYLLDCVRV